MKKNQKQWSNRWAFIIATTGAAVGLGNIWRFPYMAGTHGGGSFVVIYLIAVALVGIPLMLAEMVIGHHTKLPPIAALKKIAHDNGHSSHWTWVGRIGLLALILILSFYSVVGGFSLYYIAQSLTGAFAHATPASVQAIWSHLVNNPMHIILYHTLFMILTMGVISLGVVNGLERATKIMMPALFAILIALAIYAAVHGNFIQTLHFLFDFRWQDITGNIVLAALGHAFFTLALGAGALLMYASYTHDKTRLLPTILPIVVLDVLVAFLSGISIFPLVFAHGLSPQSGPSLMYIALPLSFSSMPFGNLVGLMFFVLLLFSAWTSSINLAEPMIATIMNKKHQTRFKSACVIGCAAWTLGLLSALSFNVLSHITWKTANLFDIISNTATDILLPLGGLGFALVAGWLMTSEQTRNRICQQQFFFQYWKICTRYLAPIAIILIMISPLI